MRLRELRPGDDAELLRIHRTPAVARWWGEPADGFQKAGFVPVGVMRDYERDPDGGGWHDALLMELVARPGPSASARAKHA